MLKVSLLFLRMWNVEERDIVVTNTETTTSSVSVFFKCVGYGVCKKTSEVRTLKLYSILLFINGPGVA